MGLKLVNVIKGPIAKGEGLSANQKKKNHLTTKQCEMQSPGESVYERIIL